MSILAQTLDQILDDIASGQPMHVAIAAHGVSSGTFYRHLDAHPADAERYARAREVRNDRLAEETLRIADEASTTGDGVAKARLQVDTRKWLLAKLAPKKYGERTVIAGDADSPLAVGLVEPKAELLRRLVAGAAAGATGSPDSGADG